MLSTKVNPKERALSDCRWDRPCSPKIGLWLPQSYPFDADQKDNLSDNIMATLLGNSPDNLTKPVCSSTEEETDL